MTQAIMTQQGADIIEQVVIKGDLSQLTPQERVSYYRAVCESVGLNPLTKPFDYISLKGKLTLYAKKDAADQLRKINGVSIDDVDIKLIDEAYIVKVKGHDKTGRSDVEIGVVRKGDMEGNAANAQMKAVTKAKRRLTLSLCGLGWLDETEVESIPDAKLITVKPETGEIISGPKWDVTTEPVDDLDAAGIPRKAQAEQEQPAPVKTAKKCSIKTPLFASLLLPALAEKTKYYNDGKDTPQPYHVLGSAAKCGYSEITADNVEAVLIDLVQHAIEQTLDVPQATA